MLDIIDTHQHLWDLNRFKLPWTAGHPVFDRSFLLADYLDAAQGLNITKTVYMEVDMAPHQLLAEALLVMLKPQPLTPTTWMVSPSSRMSQPNPLPALFLPSTKTLARRRRIRSRIFSLIRCWIA